MDILFQEEPMQRKLLIFTVCLNIIFAGVVYADDSALKNAVIKSFDPLVEKITKFFSKHPKLLTKVSSPENPKQEAFSVTHFQMEKDLYFKLHP